MGYIPGRRVRSLVSDMTFDASIYRFVLFGLLTGLLATVIRLILILRFGSPDVLKYDGAPAGIVMASSLALVLWRRPQSLRFVVKTMYLYIAGGISVKLIYLLFWNAGALYSQLLWVDPWMSVSFLLSFLILSSRIATWLSSAVLGVWVIISAVFVAVHFGTAQGREALLILSQTYFAQCIFIVFMSLYARLRGLYLVSRKSALRMEKIANTDFLLGTANRRSMQDELIKEMNRATETRTPFSVILMDIDGFKQINDRYGHDIGDAVLVEIASAVLDVVKSPNLFGRWGGDEFLLLAPDTNGIETYGLAQEIRSALEMYEFQIGRATASFGVAEFWIGENMDSLLKRADEALYQCKKLGRNRVEVAAV